LILFRYAARQTLVAFLAALGGVVALFVVIDFAENASVLTGPGWLLGVLELYANKVATVSYRMAPAAMLLAAAITTSSFRTSREYTAMRALGLGPWRLAVPILSVAAAIGLAMTIFDDYLAVDAGVRVDQIMAERFHRSEKLVPQSRRPPRLSSARPGPWRQLRGGHGARIQRELPSDPSHRSEADDSSTRRAVDTPRCTGAGFRQKGAEELCGDQPKGVPLR
jgi:lipopolysaccharide export system permease protein